MEDNATTGGLLTAAELARRLRVSRQTLDRWKSLGMPYLQPGGPGGRLYFDETAVREWAARNPTTEGAA